MKRRALSALYMVLAFKFCVAAAAPQEAASVRLQFTNYLSKPDRREFNHFLKDGIALSASEIRVRKLGDGITEISASSAALADWEFRFHETLPVYGFGERFNSLNQQHNILLNRSTDNPGAKGAGSYKPIPFFMNLGGYGIWLDTYSEAAFDLGNSEQGEFVIRFRDNHLRLLFFEGPQFPLILQRFTGLVGRPKLPPYWAFAPWKSRNWHPNMAAVNEDIDRYRELGLPASVLVLDSPWATNYNTFEINRQQFTDPEAMIRRLHQRGFKLCLWLTPFINQKTLTPSEPELVGKIPLSAASNFEPARSAGYLVKSGSDTYLVDWWKGTGGLVDFTNAAAVAWWKDQVRKAIRMGADAFKADGGEGSFIENPQFASADDASVMRTRYPVLYNQALQELIDSDLHGDGVLLMRSGSVGNHNLAFFWAGDNDASFGRENGLPSVVLAGLNAGLSGIPLWTNDLGGYNKYSRTSDDATLFIRWTEFSAFTPIMQLHSAINLGPWDYGERALGIFGQYSRLHMSLFPYRYAAAQESARSGLPLLRALVLFHPEDQEAREALDEYYFGPDLLVAPVLSGATERAVHLPEGEWIDFWSGKVHQGPTNIVAQAPLGQIPLFVKSGAILPKIPEDIMTLVKKTVDLDPNIKALDDRRVYDLYRGPARTLRDFEGREIETSRQAGAITFKLTGPPAEVTLNWRFQHPVDVKLNGRPSMPETRDGHTALRFHHGAATIVSWREAELY
jgi:alpha-D-xyloside xylohydrolase